jgi:hypothetical protein
MTCIKLIPVISLSLLVLGACGSDGSKPNGKANNGGSRGAPGTAQLTADEQACDAFYKAQIDWSHRCGGILNESQSAITRFRALCARELAAPGAEGLRDARARCIERQATAACDDTITECDQPAGTLADGEPCGSRSQCQSRFCKIDGNSSCGQCAPLVGASGECLAAADCASADGEIASCTATSQNATSGSCKVHKIVGEGATCSADAFCNTKTHCDVANENATSGKCLPNANEGAACDDTRACRTGLVCLSKKCSARPKEGEACGKVDDCADGLACNQTCKPVTYVGPGDACDGVNRCSRGRCVQPVKQDQNGQTTPAGQATCIDPLPDGNTCSDEMAQKGQLCDIFSRCVNGKCVLPDPTQCK